MIAELKTKTGRCGQKTARQALGVRADVAAIAPQTALRDSFFSAWFAAPRRGDERSQPPKHEETSMAPLSKSSPPHSQRSKKPTARSAGRSRYCIPLLERLEDRLAPALFTWNGAGDNDLWSNAANWVGGAVPVTNAV